jgi:hypothetical protein
VIKVDDDLNIDESNDNEEESNETEETEESADVIEEVDNGANSTVSKIFISKY